MFEKHLGKSSSLGFIVGILGILVRCGLLHRTSLFSVFFVKRGLRNFIDKTALVSFDTLDKSIRIRSYSDPYFPVLSVNSGKNEPE